MKVTATVAAPARALVELLGAEDSLVLSVFLPVGPDQTGKGKLRLVFRDAHRRLASSVPSSERNAFEAAIAQVYAYLEDEYEPKQAGLAVYAGGTHDGVYVVPLPYAPEASMVWEQLPRLEPLQLALDDYERIGVVLFDKENARLFTVRLGAIEERRTVRDEVPGKQATGGWAGIAQSRYARHHEEHVRQHAERTIEALLSLLRAHPFERLFIAGPAEAISILQEELPPQLRERLSGGFKLEMFRTEAEVLNKVKDAAREEERRNELNAVGELVESRQAVLGIDATLEALEDGRVDTLYVAASLAGDVRVCEACHRLVPHGVTCSWCGREARLVPELRQHVVDRALHLGAEVEVVSGEAAMKLGEHGGMGARLRY